MKTCQALIEEYNSISVIMPSFNEQEIIDKTIQSTYQFLQRNFQDFELIIVNDGSVDNTAKIIKKAIARFPLVKLISYTPNKGYGFAIRSGFDKASYAFTIKVFFKVSVRDPECAFKLYRTEKLKSLSLNSDKGGINLELLVKAKQAELRILEVGVHHYPREKGKSAITFKYTLNSLKWLIKFWLDQRRVRT